jgi:hypothetical protein
MTPDSLSGWSTAPHAARLAGDGDVFRFFDSPEAALAFIARPSANAAKQKRYRQRQRENAVVLRGVALPGAVVSALIDCGRLDSKVALDPGKIERAAIAVLVEWSREWASFSVTK